VPSGTTPFGFIKELVQRINNTSFQRRLESRALGLCYSFKFCYKNNRSMKDSYVYILANKRNGTLYIGVTSDLKKRIWQHKEKIFKGFSANYNINKLVWYEVHTSIDEAILREKQLKAWQRNWKLRLIESGNPYWDDLYESIL
jgi:putative endonuclease